MFSRDLFTGFPFLSLDNRAMGFEDPLDEMERSLSRDPFFQMPQMIEPKPLSGDKQVQQQNQLAKSAEDQQQLVTPSSRPQWLQTFARAPAVDIIEKDRQYQVNVDVPGVSKEDLKVQISEDRRGRKMLTISGERKEEHSESQQPDNTSGRISKSSRLYGKFSRSLVLPDNCSTDGMGGQSVQAAHENGVLKITLPKVPPEQHKSHVTTVKIA